MNRIISLLIISLLLLSQPVMAEEAGGYRPIPGHSEVHMPDRMVSYSEFKNMLVDGDMEISSYDPREDIPSAYPYAWNDGNGKSEIEGYLLDRYPRCRDQGKFGTCWAHAAVASAEFYAINKLGCDKSIDLSEMYLAYFIYKKRENPVVGDAESTMITMSCNDRERLNFGGNYYLVAQYMSKGFGYINEDVLPLATKSTDERFDANGNMDLNESDFRGKDRFESEGTVLVDLFLFQKISQREPSPLTL